MTPTTEKTLIELVQELSPELRAQVRDFAEFLLAKQRRELAQRATAPGWLEGFFERTAASRIAHDQPINPALDETGDLPLDESPKTAL